VNAGLTAITPRAALAAFCVRRVRNLLQAASEMLLFNPVFRLLRWENAPGLSASGLGRTSAQVLDAQGFDGNQSELVD